MGINHAALSAQSANTNVQTNNNTNTMPINHSVDMTKDIRNACGFRIYENVKGYQESTFSRDAFMATGRLTNTYHGSLFRNKKTEAVFGHFTPLPEKMADQPGYHAIIELLFPNGQTRTLTQNESIEFWAVALGLGEDDDLPFFRIKYQLDMVSHEVIDMIEEGEFRSLVFEFNDLERAFKSGGVITVPTGDKMKTREELVFYPARGYHTVQVATEIRESDELLIGIRFANASLVDESIKDTFELPVHKATKSSIRRPGRRAAAKAVAPVAPVTPEVAQIVEPVVEEPAVTIDNVPVQTIIAAESADVVNEPVEEVVEETAPAPAVGGMSSDLMAKFKAAGVKANTVQEVDDVAAAEPVRKKKASSFLASIEAKLANNSTSDNLAAVVSMIEDEE